MISLVLILIIVSIHHNMAQYNMLAMVWQMAVAEKAKMMEMNHRHRPQKVG
jgi:hypothetical protein